TKRKDPSPQPSPRVRGEGAERQIVLPTSKAIEIAFRSIRLRIGRSMLLMSGIALAMAFLVSVQTSDLITRGMRQWIELPHADRAELVTAERLAETMQQHGVIVSSGNGRQRWIVALAMLVAFVGIVNAMLMSVSERFREIGTMKCLGALDGFIVKLFLLESAFQGIVGTLIGIVLGLGMSLIGASVSYGSYAWKNLPAKELLIGIVICLA